MSNHQFRTTAQVVLDEMNKRLAEEGVEGVDIDVLNNRQKATEGKGEEKVALGVGDMFEEVHQREFNKMDSIATHYAAKRGVQSNPHKPIVSKKRKSSLVVKERRSGVPATQHRPSGVRVASGASSKKILPGGFGDEDDEDEVVDRRMSKRPRIDREEPSGSDAPAQPKRVSLAPPPSDAEEEAHKQKEREAIRRRLEHNKAKRRSSMGRPSLGRAPIPQKTKPSRFGFLSSAKSLVQGVWNRGAGSKAPSSNIPVAKPAQAREEAKAPPKATETKKAAVIPGSSGAPPLSSQGNQTKRVPSGGSTSGRPAAPGRSTLAPPVTSTELAGTMTSTRTSRSPIPSFNLPSLSSNTSSRLSTVAGHGRDHSRSGSTVGFSSLGARSGISTNRGSSMGVKPSIRTSAGSLQKLAESLPRSRTSSTLMAPTASSLAKTNSHSRIPVPITSHSENGTSSRNHQIALSPQPNAALEQITNSPRSPVQSPRTKIFSQPLVSPPAGPSMSLAAAATSIVGQVADAASSASSSKPPIPLKPKVLPGRRPRISRSKVIAKLASQRAAGASEGTEKAGKTRSSMGAGVAGKTRQSGGKGGDVVLSAKKRARQSEYARRRSRAVAGDGRPMDLD
ncbi:hypothetical protein PAXINDRAFT_168567 [Paxillus involutus ATCC 200175]|nr:hypothetical protein PAXINDRAFT_168567 [Paxillus involutus ATCC 200175]